MESSQEIQTHHSTLPPTSNSTRHTCKQPSLRSVFQPNPSNNSSEEEEPIISLLELPYQLEPPLQCFKQSEIQTVVNNLFPKTSPGYDLITGKILQELPPVAIKFITQLFNASLVLGHIPDQWKVA
jgi:hypothetical protein